MKTIDTNSLLALIGLVAVGLGLALFDYRVSLVIVGALLIGYALLPDQKTEAPK